MRDMETLLRTRGLHTVCESARCPNKGECFERGTATFLILGGTCTRNCRFCSVESGRPELLDPQEPARVADAAARMGLRHVVVTSVTRDDLPDGGAAHFAATIRALRRRLPDATVEVLVPDFGGDRDALDVVLDERPEVFNHNVETVPRLYPKVRPQAAYRRSLAVLAHAAQRGGSIVKTGLMVGLGETAQEVRAVLGEVQAVGVGVVTVGQYLRPSREHLPVVEYVTPARFDEYKEYGERLGLQVEAAPFVRSSYRAEEGFRRRGAGRSREPKEDTC
ncbi:MAG: lipoyl synthase [Actinobacteria bacterium]|nr:lipoyl synthase [Actinomycetota bacterium]